MAYLGVTNALALLRLLPMTDRDKDAEILALRHQITVLQRQLRGQKVRFSPADRAMLAALLRPLPRDVLRHIRLLVRPRHLYADRGYDHDLYRDRVRRFKITPHVARRGTEHGSGLGVHRWVVEGTIALLHWFRRLRIRWEIRDDIHQPSSRSAVPSPAGDG